MIFLFLQCVCTVIIVYIIISPLNSYLYIHWILDFKSILLLLLDTIDVCIWHIFVFMSVVVTVGVCGIVCCIAAIVEYSVFSLGALKYVVCLCSGCDGCCVLCLYCEVWSCRCLCIRSVSVSSCRCMFVSCVHPVAVLNAAFCMTCSLLMLVEDARGDHMEEAYSSAGLISAV